MGETKLANKIAERTKVLILGTENPQLEILSHQLTSSGQNLDITLITSTQEALSLLSKENFHIVVSEFSLGDMTGIEFAFELRKTKAVKPEIILLSDQKQISVHECHQLGISQIVAAPVNVTELVNAIEHSAPHSRRYGMVDLSANALGPMFGKVIGKKPPNKIYKLEVSNIGRGGFFYRITDNTSLPEIGQIVDFEVTLGMVPDTTFKGTGIVRWSRYEEGNRGYGIEFISLPEETERLLMAFVELFKVQPYVPDT